MIDDDDIDDDIDDPNDEPDPWVPFGVHDPAVLRQLELEARAGAAEARRQAEYVSRQAGYSPEQIASAGDQTEALYMKVWRDNIAKIVFRSAH
jgi:hypothetical protein